jgi:hypothetical protein
MLVRKGEQQPAGVIGPILAPDNRRAGEQKTERQLCRPLGTLCLVGPPQNPQRRLRRRLDAGASLGNLHDVAHERLLSHCHAAREDAQQPGKTYRIGRLTPVPIRNGLELLLRHAGLPFRDGSSRRRAGAQGAKPLMKRALLESGCL